ncbi:MAG: VWA domain-containing protein [Bacteroidetes bacterium]|nr:VWA domain-containing protein [Bacteroidota bacterium]
MLRPLLYMFMLLNYCGLSQLQFTEQNSDLGTIAEAYQIKGDLIIKNISDKKIFLLRADGDKNLKIFASKKTLAPNDTCLLIVSFIPSEKGKFKKNIKLISSDKEKPYELSLSGNLNALKQDDKTACFYFGSRKNSNVKAKDGPVYIPESKEPRDNSNKMPDNASEPVVTKTTPPEKAPVEEKPDLTLMPKLLYKPNNIVFLIDVSNSMKDSAKLPLMKKALYNLLDAVRDIDVITILTYSDSLKIIREGVSGADRTELKKAVSSLKAKGLTKGNKAILRSQMIAQLHFIEEGNNQIIMATDGKFRFYPDDQKKWEESQKDKKIILSTVAFGEDREAMKNLKEIADIGKGNFIQIKKKNGSEEKLLEEIKYRSKR